MFFKSGARKKKFLTDPIDFIPFPAQNLRTKVAEKPKENAPSVKLEVQKSIEQKVVQAPTGVSQVKTISIHKHSQAGPELDPVHEKLPQEEYSYKRVKMLWRQYSIFLQQNGQSTFYSILYNTEPRKIAPDRYGIEVQSEIQANMIKDQLLDMTNHFRKELQNFSFSFELVMTETNSTEIKYTNGREKFQAMVNKNPNLESFRRLFDLDIEY
ncbi:MAG: hypothetical protein V4638_05805 [Bacteroidota bacterium]